ncbi:DUF4337 family protein [Sphingomonas sp. M1A8_2b]
MRGLHEQLSEERAASGEAFDQRIALFTAILATSAAVTSFLGGHTQNEAPRHKNEAVLIKAQASDAWSITGGGSEAAYRRDGGRHRAARFRCDAEGRPIAG